VARLAAWLLAASGAVGRASLPSGQQELALRAAPEAGTIRPQPRR